MNEKRRIRAAKLVDCVPGSVATIEGKVTTPAVTGAVSLRRVQDWLESGK